MSALEDVVNSGDDEYSAEHGGRPIPVNLGQHYASIVARALPTWTR